VGSAAPRDTTAFEVRDALREPGCAVCRLTHRSVVRLLKSIAYEQVNDVDLRRQLRAAGGFCSAHAHLWAREAHSVLGTALIYRDVLHAALDEIGVAAPNGQRDRWLRGWLGRTQDDHSCPACQAQVQSEARYVEALMASVAVDADSRTALEASAGLCRRHTLAAIRSGRDGSECITQRARQAVEALIADLDEVIRKEDYRFRHEPRSDSERTAPARAIAWAAGTEGTVGQ